MTRRKTYEEVKGIVESLGFEMVSKEYINSKTPFDIKCKEGHIESTCLNNLQIRKRCPKCSIISRNNEKRVPQSVVKDVVEKEGYILHEIIEGVNCEPKRLVVQCPVGHDKYSVNYNNFSKGRRCPECKYDKNRNNIEDIKKEMESEGYIYISGDYKSNQSRLMVLCPKDHKYPTTYSLFQANKRCPHCNESKGERIVYNFLAQFIDPDSITKQHRIKTNNKTLRVDIAINVHSSPIFIEYDGIQHFMPVYAFGGEKGFKAQQKNDKLKNGYAEDNNIPLLRIPYNLRKVDIYKRILSFLKYNKLIKEEPK